MPKMTIDASQLTLEKQFSSQFPRRLGTRIRARVLPIAREAMTQIKNEMPVDTGGAAANFGEYDPFRIVDFARLAERNPDYQAIYEVEDGGLDVSFGINVEPFNYVERLNEGSSQQAPAGFIDRAAERMDARAERMIDEEVLAVIIYPSTG